MIPGLPVEANQDFSLQHLQDSYAPTIVKEILTGAVDMPVRTPVVTVLVETPRRWPHVAELLSEQLAGRPELIFQSGGSAITAASQVPQFEHLMAPLSKLLESAMGSNNHIYYASSASAVLQRLVTVARLSATPTALAELLWTYSVRLNMAGELSPATAAAEEAVALLRDVGQPLKLAGALHNLSMHLLHQDRVSDALGPSKESVFVLRAYAYFSGERAEPELLKALDTLTICHQRAGQTAEASEIWHEVSERRRYARDVESEAGLTEKAATLLNRASHLSDLDRGTEALELAQEATSILENLSAHNRAAHLANLAKAKLAIAQILGKLGSISPAIEAAEQSMQLALELVSADRGAHLAALAASFHTLSLRLRQAERYEDALLVAEQGVECDRELASADPTAFTATLASALLSLSDHLLAVGETTRAVAASREAVAIRTALARTHPADERLAELVEALSKFAAQLEGRESLTEALTVRENIVEISGRIANSSSAASSTRLVDVHKDVIDFLDRHGHEDRAFAARLRLRAVLRDLANPDRVYQDLELARVSFQLSEHLSRRKEVMTALDAARDAVRLFDKQRHADRSSTNAVAARVRLATCLAEAGRPLEALRAQKEAVTLCVEVAQSKPSDHLELLAGIYVNLSAYYAAVGDIPLAVASAKEANAAYEEAVTRYGQADLKEKLARALHNTALFLARDEQYTQALTACELAQLTFEELSQQQGGFSDELFNVRKLAFVVTNMKRLKKR